MICLLVMTDGRKACIERTIASARLNMNVDGMLRVINDDSGDPTYVEWLRTNFEDFTVVASSARRGFGGAIRFAWDYLRGVTGLTHIFHLEDDFVFQGPVPVYQMADLLDDRPEVVQVALQRQPWNSTEIAAGGLFKVHPEGYAQLRTKFDEPYLAQRMYFSTNPSVYRRSLIDKMWPEGKFSEGIFTHELLRTGTNGVPGDLVQFGYWGALNDPPRTEHIGTYRAGEGY